MTTYNLKQIQFEESFERLEDTDHNFDQPRFGLCDTDDAIYSNSIYAYTDWFYDGDDQAFSIA